MSFGVFNGASRDTAWKCVCHAKVWEPLCLATPTDISCRQSENVSWSLFFFIAWVSSSLLSLIFLVYFLLTIFFVCVLLMSTFCCPFRCDCFQVWLESARFGQPVWGQLQWAAEVHFRSFNGALCRLCVTFNKCTRYVGDNLRLPVQKNRWWMMPGAIIMWIKMKPVENYDK